MKLQWCENELEQGYQIIDPNISRGGYADQSSLLLLHENIKVSLHTLRIMPTKDKESSVGSDQYIFVRRQ